MRLNKNTYIIEKESSEYSDLETILSKLAKDNNINNVSEIVIKLSANQDADRVFYTGDEFFNFVEGKESDEPKKEDREINLDQEEDAKSIIATVVEKVANDNSIDNVESIVVSMTKEGGSIYYKFANEYEYLKDQKMTLSPDELNEMQIEEPAMEDNEDYNIDEHFDSMMKDDVKKESKEKDKKEKPKKEKSEDAMKIMMGEK